MSFWLLTIAFGLSGVFLATSILSKGLFLLLFILSGWIISLCLHEYAHALVAYKCGDFSVRGQGYLTLDPVKYSHPLLSVAFPVICLLVGGFGLPGGCVYVNDAALRTKKNRSLVSAAGPFANAVVLISLLPITFAVRYLAGAASALAEGLVILCLLQVTAIAINLLPIPGLDGFGIVEPYLPLTKRQRDYVDYLKSKMFLVFVLAVLLVSSGVVNFLSEFQL